MAPASDTLTRESDPRRCGSAVRALLLAVGMLMFGGATAFALHQGTAQPDTTAITPAMVDLGRAIFHGKGCARRVMDKSSKGGRSRRL